MLPIYAIIALSVYVLWTKKKPQDREIDDYERTSDKF
jgi:hypothetical protein